MIDDLMSYDEFLLEKKWDKSVKSSHLTEIAYDDKTEKLKVTFHDGSIYEYEGITKGVFRDLADEPNLLNRAGNLIKKGISKLTKKEIDEGTYGTRFWDLIRRENYKYTKTN